jgi:hypothetical protein
VKRKIRSGLFFCFFIGKVSDLFFPAEVSEMGRICLFSPLRWAFVILLAHLRASAARSAVHVTVRGAGPFPTIPVPLFPLLLASPDLPISTYIPTLPPRARVAYKPPPCP